MVQIFPFFLLKTYKSRLWLVNVFELGDLVSLRNNYLNRIRGFSDLRACNGGGVRRAAKGTLLLSQVLLGRNNGRGDYLHSSTLFLLASGTESFLVCN